MFAIVAATIALQVAPQGGTVVLSGEEAAFAARVKSVAIDAVAAFTGEACPAATVTPIRSLPAGVESGNLSNFPVSLERVRVEGCGRSTIQNVMAARKPIPETWELVSEYPGETRMAPNHINAYTPQMWTAVYDDLSPDCGRPRLDDTYVAANPGQVGLDGDNSGPGKRISMSDPLIDRTPDLDRDGAWVEVWMFRVCGHNRPLGLVLVPSRNGGLAMRTMPIWTMITDNADLPARVDPAPWVN